MDQNTADVAAIAERHRHEQGAISTRHMLDAMLGAACDTDGWKGAPRLLRRALAIKLRATLELVEASLAGESSR